VEHSATPGNWCTDDMETLYRAGFGEGPGGPGPRPTTMDGPPTKLLILFIFNSPILVELEHDK